MKHKHHFFMVAFANGEELERKSGEEWRACHCPSFNSEYEYRIKPKTPHKLRDVMLAFANGETIQFMTENNGKWTDVDFFAKNFDIFHGNTFPVRIKPKTPRYKALILTNGESTPVISKLYYESQEDFESLENRAVNSSQKRVKFLQLLESLPE